MILAQKLLLTTGDTQLIKNKYSTTINSIVMCNTSSQSVTYRIYRKKGVDNYSKVNAVFYDVELSGNTSDLIEFGRNSFVMSDPRETIAVQCNTIGAMSVTIDGVI